MRVSEHRRPQGSRRDTLLPGLTQDAPTPDTAGLVRRAVADSRSGDGELLEGYLEILAAVAATGRRLARHEVVSRRELGIAAAEAGVPLATVVDLYLNATWLSWRHLPKAGTDESVTAVLRAVNDAVGALADGYQSAQRSAIRHEEAMRREFIDDLLQGGSDPSALAQRAERFGLQLAGRHVVVVARATQPFADCDASSRRIAQAFAAPAGRPGVLITTKDAHLVCVLDGAEPDTDRLVAVVRATVPACRVGIGRRHHGPLGVARSYREARDILNLADRLQLRAPIVKAAELLVFQVLFRDREAIIDLVATVLVPLQRSRGGAGPLIDTLAAYFTTGSAAAAARHLHLGVRTVTYRLTRIQQLTGYHPGDPSHRLTLEAAVLGSRLLNWPADPLPQS